MRPPLVALALLFGICATPAAPVPKDRGKPALYFPTKVGTKWVYEDESGGNEQTYRVTEAKEKDGAIIVTVEMDLYNPNDGRRTVKDILSVSDKGVFRLGIDRSTLK